MAMSRPLTAIALAVICMLAVEANRTPNRIVVTRNQLSAIKQTLDQNAAVKDFEITVKGDNGRDNNAFISIAATNVATQTANVEQKLQSGRRLMSGGSSRRFVVTRNQLSAIKQTLDQNAAVKNFEITIEGDNGRDNNAYVSIAATNVATQTANVEQKLQSGRRLMSGGSSRRFVVTRNQLSAIKQTLDQNAAVKNFEITVKGDNGRDNNAYVNIAATNTAGQYVEVEQKQG